MRSIMQRRARPLSSVCNSLHMSSSVFHGSVSFLIPGCCRCLGRWLCDAKNSHVCQSYKQQNLHSSNCNVSLQLLYFWIKHLIFKSSLKIRTQLLVNKIKKMRACYVIGHRVLSDLCGIRLMDWLINFGGVVVELLHRMRDMRVRNPVGTDLSR